MGALRGLAAASLAALSLGAAETAHAQFLNYWQYPGGIGVSPDGRNVYVTASYSTLALARDPATGALTRKGTHTGAGGPLEVSPDGRSVYAGSYYYAPGASVTAFVRDPESGTLRDAPVTGWTEHKHVADIAVSPDSSTVYATNKWDNDLAFFSREGDGSLTYRGSAAPVPGIEALGAMAISPDGRWLYAVGRHTTPGAGSVVVRFDRLSGGSLGNPQTFDCGPGCDSDTAVLSSHGWLYMGAFGPTAARWDSDTGDLGAMSNDHPVSSGGDEPGGSGLALAPDGTLYVADNWQHRLLQLRPTADGYTIAGAYHEDQDGARGLRSLRAVAVAPGGEHVYVVGGANSANEPGTVAVFDRDPASGNLRFSSLFTGTTPPPALSVEINDGDNYTDNRNVVVRVSGGTFFRQHLELANDGGFGDGKLFSARTPEPTLIRWRLATTGPERLPKTVYVREAFQDWRGETASDTIVLDETGPAVLSASRVRGRARLLRVRARDRLSGVAGLQVTRNRRHPGRWRRYGRHRRYSAARSAVFVRARDRAGNRSRWRKVAAVGRAR